MLLSYIVKQVCLTLEFKRYISFSHTLPLVANLINMR